jgi:NAD+ diphosphatase
MTLDRCSDERRRSLAELMREPGAQMLVTDGVQFGVDGSRLARVAATACDDALFLGRNGGAPLFLVRGVRAERAEMLDFRAAARVLTPGEVSLLAYAQGMLNWDERTRFCSACGGALESRNAGYSRVCPDCAAEFFPRLDPAVMILATNRDRILLARHQGRGAAFWSTLAGFVEPGETLEQAVLRELREETGVAGSEVRYFGSQPWPLPASLMIGFEVVVEDDTLAIDESELIEARWFLRSELAGITTSSTISLSGQMIEAWRGSR